jgi:F-type H+-transporting ATPase subunit b
MIIGQALAAESAGMPQFEATHYPAEIFWSIVSFIILFILLNRYVLPRIHQSLDERKAMIEQEIETARTKHVEADALRAELQQQLDDIEDTARRRMQQAENEARRYRQQTIEETETMLARRQRQYMEELEEARRHAVEELRHDTAEMAASATEKLLGHHLSSDDGRTLVDEALEALKEQKLDHPPRKQ